MKRKKPAAPLTAALIGICILITAVIQFWPGSLNTTERAILFGAYYKAFICAGEWHRLLTAGIVHAGLAHLLMNMVSLYILGGALEPGMNPWKYLLLLCGSVLGGSVFVFCISGNTVAAGISGGLYGLLASYIYLVWESGVMKIPQVRTGVIYTLLMNLMINFMPGVAWQAHLGGAVTGLLILLSIRSVPSKTELRRNSVIALVVLCIAAGAAMKRNASVSKEEAYLLTDINLLTCESELGFSSYASHMAEKLDSLYELDYLKKLF
ncbi:MAG: rhomboid family intramembrane serine protease [Solobacterium sp.]|nr:rhomboid family intramembrane serine protease [Solobacterium sp.]